MAGDSTPSSTGILWIMTAAACMTAGMHLAPDSESQQQRAAWQRKDNTFFHQSILWIMTACMHDSAGIAHPFFTRAF
jgi:hypothetical protein